MRVAAIQMCTGIVPDANLVALEDMVAKAVGAGAQYVLTPEVSLVFARNTEQLRSIVTPETGKTAIEACAEMARRRRVYLHIGSLALAHESGRFVNRSLLFAPDGDLVSMYDKIHLFDADPPNDRPYHESDSYVAGDRATIADVDDFQLGLTICYDLRFPKLFNRLASVGAEMFSVPAAFTVPTGQAHWEVLLRSRAIETGAYVVAAAQGGQHENGRATYGHSMIIDPWGKIIAHKGDDSPGFIVADIDKAKVADARARIPALANTRPFSLSVNHKRLG